MFGISAAQVHLAFNHLPVLGSFLASAAMLSGVVTRRPQLRFLGLAMALLAAVAIVPTYLSGEGAEEIVEDRPGVSETLIERHEEAAEGATWIMVISGIGAALVLAAQRLRRKQIARALFAATLAASLLASLLLLQVAHLGGQIRHDEIRPQSAQAAARPGPHSSRDDDD